MNVNFETLVVDHVVQVLGSLEVFLSFVCGREIINWEMHDGLYSISLVEFLCSGPINVQFAHLFLVLETKDRVDASIGKSSNILVSSWI